MAEALTKWLDENGYALPQSTLSIHSELSRQFMLNVVQPGLLYNFKVTSKIIIIRYIIRIDKK